MAESTSARRPFVDPVVEVITFDPHEDIVCTSGLTPTTPDQGFDGTNWPLFYGEDFEG
ncbi:MAG: hypothetical protein Q4B77_01410 [Coriobacteriaceae bacterium]|nr:hypothetical protein [Coriobacteriaceae bacterium]